MCDILIARATGCVSRHERYRSATSLGASWYNGQQDDFYNLQIMLRLETINDNPF